MAFLICILLLLAVLIIGTRKNSCVLVHEDYRYNKNNTSGFWCRCEGPAEASMHIAITVISSNMYAFITAVVSCNLYRHNHAVVYHN